MAAELEKENYRGKDQINKREREILTRWDELLVLLERHRLALQSASQLMSVMRDLDTVASTIRDLEVCHPNIFSVLPDWTVRFLKSFSF